VLLLYPLGVHVPVPVPACCCTCHADSDPQADLLSSAQSCELALFFHDAVYDPTKHDNEAKSAQMLSRFASELREQESVEAPVAHLVRAPQAAAMILRTATVRTLVEVVVVVVVVVVLLLLLPLVLALTLYDSLSLRY